MDIIFICASKNKTTINLINKSFLEDVKKDIIIVNPARGNIVDLNSLINFLAKNKNSEAYIDVYPQEPYPLEDLQNIKNLYKSCHIAGVYEEMIAISSHLKKRLLIVLSK